MRRFLLSLLLVASIFIGVGGMMTSVPTASAQETGLDTGLAEVGETVILPDTDPRIIAARIINIAFGLIGIIMVSIILYAGFLYMTSGGDAEKTQTALKYIRNAVIGLIIILMSWAITRFVVERLLEATGAGGGGGVSTGPGGGGPGGGGFGGGGGPRPFEILAITPSGTVDTKKVIVKVVFNKNVDETPAADAVIVEKFDGTAVPGTIVVSGRTIRFTPSAACPPPNADRFCLDDDTDYRIRVAPSLEDVSGQQITCGGFSPSCEGSFRSGTTVDVTPPTITITYPVTGQSVPGGSLVDVNAYATDETGVSYVSVSADGVILGEAAPSGSSPRQFDARVSWDTAGLAPGSSHTLTATAYDVDSGSAVSTPVVAIVRAEHCFNGVQDGGETGLDCGGAAGPEACGACSGSSCSTGSSCSSGVCTGGICVEQPIITSVSPLNGAPGTYVTIRGTNFGNNGRVTFVGPDASSGGVDAIPPSSCVAAGARHWSPTQVVVEVPAGAPSGPLRLTNNASGLADATNAPPNPFINDFLVDDTLRPGICSVVPIQGTPGQAFRLVGTRFGDTAASILFGDRVLGGTSWADAEVRALIPSVDNGAYPVAIQVGGARSNTVAMNVLPRTGGGPPELTGVEPASGPVGTYVTLLGRNFGASTGQVFFKDVATGREALADTGFPEACTASFWGNESIIVKVPVSFTSGGTGGLAAGAYTVRVVTASPSTPASNERNFAVTTDPARPGICAVVPSVAPIGTEVTVYGERFGSDPGTVTFSSGKNGANSPWSSTEISSAIPSGAVSGLVTVTTPSLLASNGYPIEVRNCNEEQNLCRTGDECCGDGSCRPSGQCAATGGAGTAMFAWRTSTGLIPQAPRVVEECRTGALPSPSPWTGRSGGDNACVNATVLVRFTTQVEPVTVSSDSILVFECTGSGSDPCTERADVPLASGSPRVSAADATQDYVTLDPQTVFKGSTTYEVVLTTAIRGAGETGAPMAENASRCGVGNAYCFRFRTRADTEPCGIGSIAVAPDPYTAREQGPLPVDHRATPISRDDACTVLDCRSYDWSWSTSDGRASISNRTDGTGGACEQTATAQLETGDDPVQVMAATEGVTGSGDLYINFIPPHVERHGPDCDAACTNAAIWAVFNVALDPSSVNASNVSIQRCGNENCLDLDPPLPLSDTAVALGPVAGSSDTRARQVTIEPVTDDGTSLLVAGRFYKVTLRGGFTGGIQSVAGVPMDQLNDPEGFAWTFRVRSGEGICTVDRVEVVPLEKYESRIGARQGFTATPFSSPDACSESGQQLLLDSGFAWSSSDESVAVLVQGGAVDTGGALPPGCSGRCTLLGAAGRADRTAQCGNGRVETTNIAYCEGGVTPWGDSCARLPSNGKGGEECDDGNAEPNDECSNTCVWNPVSPVDSGGSCGNGSVERGEDCDAGRVCTGMSAESILVGNPECTSDADAAQCAADGGTCATPTGSAARGCSPTCRNLGSVAGNSSCGNGSVGDGEDCDDGNSRSGDGCSANCLHEGSSRAVYALCGNGVMEPGEACEQVSGGSWPAAGCDPVTCRHAGSLPCASPDDASCCGNGNPDEPGKDCDDGNTVSGDGCSAVCLAEGSSAGYAFPSFCSNGILETGEQCESPGPAFAGDTTPPSAGGDGRPDGFQLAEIVGEGTPDAEGRMSSTLTASLGDGGESGSAIYGLQCGFTDERQCSTDRLTIDPETGLTTAGCCSARPRLAAAFPPTGAGEGGVDDPFPEGVCRNVLISGQFAVEMEESSVRGNFLVAKRVADVSCPAGTQDVTDAGDLPTGFRGFALRTWARVLAFFRIPSALAQRWCAGTVPGSLTIETADGTTDFFYTLDTVLDPRTEYRVRFLGDADLTDNAASSGRTGVRSTLGVVAIQDTEDDGPLTWHFRTGDVICQLNSVRVRDLSLEHPTFFTRSGETHPFVAHAEALVNGRPVPLSPTPSYAWAWQDWVFSNPALLAIQPPDFAADQDLTVAVTTKDVVAKDANGTGFLSARVGVTADTVNPASTEGRVVQGTIPLTVNLCENPWPSLSSAPFRDMQGSADLRGTPFENGPFFNFSMTYCRDAGVPGPNEDLPSLLINGVAPNAVDAAQGVLRQYLFTFGEESLQKDGIGVRVAANPLHLSPLDWYRSKGFTGSPQSLTVDGYEAIRDGRTVYVGAVNTEGPDATGRPSDLYSNIYLISYNEGAEPITRQVYDALLASFAFNVNVQSGVANACEDASGVLQSGPDGLPLSCTADWECSRLGEGMTCANFKGKVARDLARLGDFQEMTKSLQSARTASGSYPRLATGSYLPGVSTSLWPSWEDSLKTALGNAALPGDPVNRFETCGRCTGSNAACVADADCGQGSTCTPQDGYHPRTCWNEVAKQFLCPSDGEGSRFYRYRALEGGTRFELASEFEVPPPNPSDLNESWWKPAPLIQVRLCTNPGMAGNVCRTDADCRACPAGNCSEVPVVSGTCQPGGGQFRYSNICRGEAFGTVATCGDGIIDADPTHTSCLGGSRNGDTCTASSDCPGGSCQPNEICELTGPTATRIAACTLDEGGDGSAYERCVGCRAYAPDPAKPGCFALRECGNGRVDGVCSNDETKPCSSSAECGGEACEPLETCDDGVLNGRYGRCNLTCDGYGGFCGDGQISPGETCDSGDRNGDYCADVMSSDPLRPVPVRICLPGSGCNATCTGPAPQCGDGHVDAGESCDGGTQTTASAVCTTGLRGTPCKTNADCGEGGVCGGDVDWQACPLGQAHRRFCGSSDCRYSAWTSCQPIGQCGDGVKDPLEVCDDGNDVNEDGCTNACERNICGDGFFFRGVEECDLGTSRNGLACTNAEYGSTCTSCSLSCKFQLTQGGYCGDGKKNPGTPEQCDGQDFGPSGVSSLTCKQLGFDYLADDLSAIQCTSQCRYGGCVSCGETPGDGTIVEGHRWRGGELDGLGIIRKYSLFYRGLLVGITTSSGSGGRFRFRGMNEHSECDQYFLVADYVDDPRSTRRDESRIHSFVVGPFSVETFKNEWDNDGRREVEWFDVAE